MRCSSSRPLALCLGAAALAAAFAPGALAQEPNPELAVALEHSVQRIGEVRARLAAHPEDAAAWSELIGLEGHRTLLQWNLGQISGGEELSSEAVVRDAYLAACREWIAARPEDSRPYLALADYQPTAETRSEVLRQLLERFPGDADVAQSAASDLRNRGSHRAATELLENFLRRNSDQAEAYRGVVQHHRIQGSGGRARELLDEWVRRFPHDPAALELWLEMQVEGLSPEEARQAGAEAVARMEASPSAVRLCHKLSWLATGALRTSSAECYRKVLALELPDEDRVQALGSYTGVLAQLGDGPGLDRALEAVPPEKRSRAVLTAAGALQNQGRCDEKVLLLGRIAGYHEESMNVPEYMARILADCGSHAAARELFLGILSSAPSRELSSAVGSGKKIAPPEAVEAVLGGRLHREPEDDRLWEALDGLYKNAGLFEKRLEHLQAWVARRPSLPGDRRLGDLTDLLVMAGRSEEAVRVLEGAVAGEGPLEWQPCERLATLYLLEDKPEKVEALAARFAEGADEDQRHLSHLLRARVALAQGRLEPALGHYRELYAAASPFDGGAAEEYLALLNEAGLVDEAVRFLEGRWELLYQHPRATGDRARFMVESLAAAGFTEAALVYSEKRQQRAPGSLESYRQAAELARDLGDWPREEAAYRAIIALDPKASEGWDSLAWALGRREDPARGLEVLDDAYEAIGHRPPRLLFLEGRMRLETGDAVGAIRALRRVLELNPNDGYADELLREAYRVYAGQPD
jgi:tetratricopeptide (TPR) repeat protein